MRSVTFTFVGDDAVADFLEDLRQAGGASHLDVLLRRRQAPRPHRARGLEGGKLGHEDICGRAEQKERSANGSAAKRSVSEPTAPRQPGEGTHCTPKPGLKSIPFEDK